MNPKISVIIPTYNRAQLLPRAIQSVVGQDFKDWELLIIDDGSSDNTKEVLKLYKDDRRISVFTQGNHGVSHARNRAVEMAQGEWLSFLDSDDEWFTHKLSSQIKVLETQSDVEIIHGEEIWIRNGVRVNPMKKHEKKSGDVFKDALKLCCISPSTVLLKKTLFEKHKGFREDFPVCEDYDLWLKITSEKSVGFVSSPIIKKYGGHSDQLSRKYFAMDYWRILAIDDLLKKPLLDEKRQLATKELHLKCNILLKGYRKHQNLERFDQIFNIQKFHQLN